MLSKLKTGKKLVGQKQSRRAVEDGRAQCVFMADDASASVTEPISELCGKHGVEVVMVPTMAELGSACGIEVGAAVAVLIEE